MGCSAPPPMPCRTRKKISSPSDGRQAAQERADGEQRHADHVEALAAEQHGEPAAHGQDDGVGNQVGGEHPGGFVDAGREAAGDVRQRDVGDAGIQHLHEGGQHDGHGDHPGVDGGVAALDACGTRRCWAAGPRLALPPVERLHLSDGVGQVGARLVVAVERADLVVVGARQLVLGGDHFDVVGHAGLEAVARLVHFLARQFDSQVGHVHFAARGFQLRDGGLHFQGDAVAQLLLLLLELADGQVGLGALGLDAAAGEEREIQAALVLIDRDDGVGSEPLLRPR